jgi:succinyl-CoA synthetase beta subunit
VPKGVVVSSAAEAESVYKSGILGKDVVVKAQVLAGGRGKGTFKNGFKGGVRMVSSAGEAKEIAGKMLGQLLVTKQTGAEGKPCNKVFLMERLYLRRETYFSILMDRANNGPTLVGSPAGGMNIEEVAHETPHLIFTEKVDVMRGVEDAQVERLARSMGFEGGAQEKAKQVMKKLYDQFIATDGTLVEINPLAETPSGDVFCCDAKLNFDSNAEFRQERVFAYRDRSQEDPREIEADNYGLNYIGLDGSIGCMVNGAGLAMATMDIIKLNGGSPANFLDVGGGANKQQVQKAFEILNADKKVKAIFVNIFGGIMRCDVIATGIVAAAQQIGLKKPIIIRLRGTKVDEAKALIEASGYRMMMTDDLDEAAQMAVKVANIVQQAEQIKVGVSFEIPL